MGPTPFGLDLFAVLSAGAAQPLATGLLGAIYQYWYSNASLKAAFPGTDGLGAGALKIRQSEFGAPLPRAVVFKVSIPPASYTTGDSYTFIQLVQFSVFAATFEDSEAKAYVVQQAFHKHLFTFANGYVMAAFAGEPVEMPPEVAPGASEEYHHVVEVKYVIGRSLAAA
jgi:hypothetical protein